jgi:dynamin GTPase
MSLIITSAAHSTVVLKAESMADKTEWVARIKSIVAKRTTVSEGGSLMRQSHSDGSLVSRKFLLILPKSSLVPGV